MTWLTWRQHRAQALFAAIGLAILAAGILLSGLAMFDSLTELGLDACGLTTVRFRRPVSWRCSS